MCNIPYRYLTLPYLTLPYLTLPYLTLPYLTLPYLTSADLTFTFYRSPPKLHGQQPPRPLPASLQLVPQAPTNPLFTVCIFTTQILACHVLSECGRLTVEKNSRQSRHLTCTLHLSRVRFLPGTSLRCLPVGVLLLRSAPSARTGGEILLGPLLRGMVKEPRCDNLCLLSGLILPSLPSW